MKEITVDQLKKELEGIITNYLEDASMLKGLHDGTNLINDLNIDSVDVVEIIIDIEEKYNIEIEDSEIGNIQTYKNILDLIMSKATNSTSSVVAEGDNN